jgi:UDP-N-acetylmuramate--alanine ligase
LYPDKKITVIFQPHLYSRTRDFAESFAQSLDIADEIVLMDIYPARELPIEGVSSKIILENMQSPLKQVVKNSELLDIIADIESDIYLTVGAGDIDQFVLPIKSLLKSQI